MELTFKVEGMMCPKCEARARKALEAVTGVETAAANHNKGTAVVIGEALDEVALRAAIEEAGYHVIG